MSGSGNGDFEIEFSSVHSHVQVDEALAERFPFSAIGSFDNGCSGHLVTVFTSEKLIRVQEALLVHVMSSLLDTACWIRARLFLHLK